MLRPAWLNGEILDVQAEQPVRPGVALYTVTYRSQQYRVKGLLAVPEPPSHGLTSPRPGLVYCRGGIKSVGRVRPERIAQLASHGWVVLAPHYRGNEGGEGRDEFGGADRHDVFAAYRLLRGLSIVDPSRVSLLGFSRGGIMALLAAMECDGVHAAVVWNGVTDLLLTYRERVDLRRMLRRVVGHPRKDLEAYLARSPLYRARDIACPVLIIHGTRDENVGVEHAMKLARELEALNKPYELWLAAGAGHAFEADLLASFTSRMFAWLEQPFTRTPAGSEGSAGIR